MISCHTESVLAGLDGLLWEGDHVFTSKEWEKIERAREMEVFFYGYKKHHPSKQAKCAWCAGDKTSSTLYNILPYRKQLECPDVG